MTTKTLASSLALLAASSMLVAQAANEPAWQPSLKGTTINAVGFENFPAGTTPATTMADDGTTDSSKAYFLYQGSGEDGSVVTNHANFAYAGNIPAYFSTFTNAKFLSLSTEGGTLFRSLNILDTTGETPALGTAEAITDALYVDTLVQFTPCDSDPDVGSENKLAVWLSVTNDVTNICVRAGYWDYANSVFTQTPKTYTLANTSAINVEAGEWVRLTVKAIKNVYTGNQYEMPAFQVYINDTLAEFNEPVASASAIALQSAAGETLSAKTTLPSMQIAATLQAVGFQGTGAVDDFVVTTDKPGFLAVDFTLYWDTNITALEAYLEGEQDPVTFTIANYNHVFSGMGDGDTIEIEIPGEGTTAAATGYEIDWANTVLTNVTMAATYEDDNDKTTLYAYTFTLDSTVHGEGIPYSIKLVTRSTAPAGVNFDLTWPAGWTAVSYTINGGEAVAISGTSPLAITGLVDGNTVSFTFQNADGVTKTINATVADGEVNGIDVTGTTFTWADYLGDVVAGAYEIDNLAELKLFQKGVAAGLATASTTFKLTADVTLDAAWPGIGLQNGKDVYTTQQFNDEAFCGTFDGQNHTISGFQMVGVAGNPANNGEGLDYCGFFNSAYGATIQNLKIAYAGSLFAADTTSSTKESGATFVGVAKNSTLRNLTTVAGTVSCSKGFGGIVGFLTTGTTVDSCTNNVNMTSLANNKCGGIAMITQGGSAVTISNCQNNGTMTTSSSNSEYGGIVGYIGLDTTIANCETTVGRFLKHQTGTVTLQGVNKGDARVAAYDGIATPGLNFATVDGDVATFVADSALALNGSYKVMGPSATATATFEFTDLGTIAFDETLSTPTYAITYSGAAGVPTSAKSGDVTTWTAGYFPRTATAGQEGTAANPFEIADVDDLQALAAYTAGHGLCYVQTADINMASAGTFPGIGGDFTGTYDGGNKTISNIQFAADTYRGLFNKTTGATIKNLTINTVSFAAAGEGVEFGGSAFVGKVYADTVLSNLTATGSVAAGTPCNHSVAGIATRVYGTGVKFFDCVNTASVYGEVRKVGGLLGIIQGTASVDFVGCSNSGTIVTTTKTHHDIGDNKDYTTGADGLGGIIAYANAATTLKNCSNTGAIQTHVENTGAAVGGLIGKCGSVTITDLGGNSCAANMKMIGVRAGTITGFQYATVSAGVATTVLSIAAGGDYLLEGPATPSITLADGESITFDTALGYALTDSSIAVATGLERSISESGTKKTFSAAAGTTPIEPGQQDATTYNDIAAASNAAAKVEIAVPTAVTTAGVDAGTYKALFEAKVVSNGEGGYNVVVDLKDAVVETLEEQAEDGIAGVAAVLTNASATEATLETTPGLYYSFQYGYSVNGMTYNTASVLATGSTTTLDVPAKAQTAGFYKLVITTTPRAANEPSKE